MQEKKPRTSPPGTRGGLLPPAWPAERPRPRPPRRPRSPGPNPEVGGREASRPRRGMSPAVRGTRVLPRTEADQPRHVGGAPSVSTSEQAATFGTPRCTRLPALPECASRCPADRAPGFAAAGSLAGGDRGADNVREAGPARAAQ